MPTPSMPGPTVQIYQVDSLHHVVKTPCGNTSLGITTSEDLPIQVRRALEHASTCEECLGDSAPQLSPTFNPAYRIARCGMGSVHAPHVVDHGPDQPRNCPGMGGDVR
jgi:hypothetical protein